MTWLPRTGANGAEGHMAFCYTTSNVQSHSQVCTPVNSLGNDLPGVRSISVQRDWAKHAWVVAALSAALMLGNESSWKLFASPNVQMQKLRHRGELQRPPEDKKGKGEGPRPTQGCWRGREEEEQAPYLSEGKQVLLLLLQVPLALLDELIH